MMTSGVPGTVPGDEPRNAMSHLVEHHPTGCCDRAIATNTMAEQAEQAYPLLQGKRFSMIRKRLLWQGKAMRCEWTRPQGEFGSVVMVTPKAEKGIR
ncbi:hypothetical protein BHE74_00033753 [Ensete ventricosum]|nr:hypothetical protein BHE74_00033753 [Ensete ventricosum]